MDKFEKNLNSILIETFNTILKFEETALKKYFVEPITISEAHMIEAIGTRAEVETTVSDIASAMSISTPTATVAIKKLERKGYVKKSPCTRDGRKMLVTLTPYGKEVYIKHRLFHTEMARNVSNQFHDSEKEILLRVMTKLSEFFKKKVEA